MSQEDVKITVNDLDLLVVWRRDGYRIVLRPPDFFFFQMRQEDGSWRVPEYFVQPHNVSSTLQGAVSEMLGYRGMYTEQAVRKLVKSLLKVGAREAYEKACEVVDENLCEDCGCYEEDRCYYGRKECQGPKSKACEEFIDSLRVYQNAW